MRFAYVEPVVGLNVYGRELLPHLARYAQIDVVTSDDRERLCADVAEGFPLLRYEELVTRQADYDHVIFQLRNNGAHVPVRDLALSLNGVAVMHEINLPGVVGAKTLRHGRRLAFLRWVAVNEGPLAGLAAGLDLFVRRRPPVRSHWLMNRDVIRRSQGVIVHNHDAARQLRQRYPTLPIQVINRGVPPALPFDQETVKRELGLSGRFPVIASFGVIHARKRIAQALEAFAQLARQFPEAVYVLVGRVVEFDLEGTVARLGLNGRVVAPGRVDDETFHRYLAVTDIGVNLRYPFEGETSSTALRIMSYGKPVLVTNAGSLAELPDFCTIKVDPGPDEVAQIRSALLELSHCDALRQKIGNTALAYVRQHHTWERAAQTYHQFLEQLASLNDHRLVR
jgi:glycosyltransferase involved in cell wall biosynthesis